MSYNLEQFCHEVGLEIYRKAKTPDGFKYQLKHCPFDASHTNGDAALFLSPNGPGFFCFHDSCRPKKWADVRKKYGARLAQTEFKHHKQTIKAARADLDLAFRLDPLPWSEFAKKEYKREWLVKNAVTLGENLIIGGQSKSLKTTIAVDLCISVACGVPFLGELETPKKRKVLLLSGESGEAALQSTAYRVAKSKGVDPSDNLLWLFELPTVSKTSHLIEVSRVIAEYGVEFLVLDPAYLSLYTDGGDGAANMFSIGPLLRSFGDLANEHDWPITLALVHHTNKGQQPPMDEAKFRPVTINDLAYSGFSQWCRQWMLIGRRTPYAGAGMHALNANIGGSAGHSYGYDFTIDEGVGDVLDPYSRHYLVSNFHERGKS